MTTVTSKPKPTKAERVAKRVRAFRALGDTASAQLTADVRAGGDRCAAALILVETALRQHNGVVLHAAEALGVSKWTLFRLFADHEDLQTMATKLRHDSGMYAEHMANARAHRRPKKAS